MSSVGRGWRAREKPIVLPLPEYQNASVLGSARRAHAAIQYFFRPRLPVCRSFVRVEKPWASIYFGYHFCDDGIRIASDKLKLPWGKIISA